MEIKKLISVFERLLPIYKEAYKDDLGWWSLLDRSLQFGLCCASNYELRDVFGSKGYYKNLIGNGGLLFPYPHNSKDLKSRIDFMESEIKDLKRLIRKGYTHV